EGAAVEALCLLTGSYDLLIYDLAALAPRAAFTGARILRTVQGRTRQFLADGTPVGKGFGAGPEWQLVGLGEPVVPLDRIIHGYDGGAGGSGLRARRGLAEGTVETEDTLRSSRDRAPGHLGRELRLTGVPWGAAVVVRPRLPAGRGGSSTASTGRADSSQDG